MVSITLYIRNDQSRFLRKLKGNMSEHIRSAIDDYIAKKVRETLNVSFSLSKQKGDDTNGTSEPEYIPSAE